MACSHSDRPRRLTDDWLLICVANSLNQQLITQNNILLFRNNASDKALSASQGVAVQPPQEICKTNVKMYSMLAKPWQPGLNDPFLGMPCCLDTVVNL